MQQMTMVMPGWAARRMPCWVPATAKDASPIVSMAWDSHPSMPVPMCDRTDTRDSIGQKTKVARAVTTHIVTYSTCRGRVGVAQTPERGKGEHPMGARLIGILQESRYAVPLLRVD